jgi:pimeloyl-ACP methyl ester carboxylesterase
MAQTLTLRVHGLSIEASAAGNADKPSLVILHGGCNPAPLYDGVTEELSADFHVFSIDLPNFGGSRGAPPSAP